MAGITDILTAIQNAVIAINSLKDQVALTFPQVSALSTSATTGTITFNSSQPASFLTIITSSGATAKVALYNP